MSVLQPFVNIPVTPISAGFRRLWPLAGCQTGSVTTLDSCCEGVQLFSKLGQSFQHHAHKLATTLCRQVGALVLRQSWGGSLIHAAFFTVGLRPTGSVPDKRLVVWTLSIGLCLWAFPLPPWRRMAGAETWFWYPSRTIVPQLTLSRWRYSCASSELEKRLKCQE